MRVQPDKSSKPQAIEGLLIDVLRLVTQGRAGEVGERVRKAVTSPAGRRKLGMSESARASILALLAEGAPEVPDTGTRMAMRRVGKTEPKLRRLNSAPILDEATLASVEQIVLEHEQRERLSQSGLAPTRTILLSGPPGVGKTMTMRWVAERLAVPLVQVEPGSVIGSLLGESSRSLSEAFTEAEHKGAVLGLDEIDALAKRRDDVHEIGEFKRFVSTLLLELDRWSGRAPVIAATNHLDLLDPALQRRFEVHLEIGLPDSAARRAILSGALSDLDLTASDAIVAAIADIAEGGTGSSLTGLVNAAARRSALSDEALETGLLKAASPGPKGTKQAREAFAAAARDTAGLTSRAIGELLGCSHTAAQRLANAGSLRVEN